MFTSRWRMYGKKVKTAATLTNWPIDVTIAPWVKEPRLRQAVSGRCCPDRTLDKNPKCRARKL